VHGDYSGGRFGIARFAGVRIDNGFDVQASRQAAWALLTDVPRVVPCMPGASLERTIDEQTWEVLQTVKLGPISLQLRSEVKQEQLSEAEGIAVLTVKAKEVKGKGGAEATIRSSLRPTGNGTRVEVATEVELRGAVAQYGRPVLGSVAEELTRQFAICLAAMLAEEGPAERAPEAKPIGGLRLLLRSLWRRLFRRG
jgi:carbon monoxide dehydrogenase subunit G